MSDPRPAERRIDPAAGDTAALAALGLADPVPIPSADPFREPVYTDGPWPGPDDED